VRTSYDQLGRVRTQQDADNGQVSLACSTPAAGVTRVTDQRTKSA
jgi:hypothetical protein